MQKVHSMDDCKDYIMNSRLQQLQKALTSVIEDMSPAELQRHPEGKWSAREILEHLYLTYTNTTKGLEKCLAAAKPMGRKPSVKDRVASVLVTKFGYLPEGRESPERAKPRGTPIEQVVAELTKEIQRMDDAIAACEKRHGKRAKLLDHPVLGPLNGNEWRGFHCSHGRHHIKQIQRLRQN